MATIFIHDIGWLIKCKQIRIYYWCLFHREPAEDCLINNRSLKHEHTHHWRRRCRFETIPIPSSAEVSSRTVSPVSCSQYGQRDNSWKKLVLSLQRQLWKCNHSSLNFWRSLKDLTPTRLHLSLKCDDYWSVQLRKASWPIKAKRTGNSVKYEVWGKSLHFFPRLESFAEIGEKLHMPSHASTCFLSKRTFDQRNGETWG